MRISLVTLAFALAAAPLPGQTANLSSGERAVADWARAHRAEAELLLERLVNQNSGTQNFAGVRAVGAILEPELAALGFKTEWIDGAPFKRAGHLVAERRGPGPRLLLIGHLDTVFEPDHPFQRFERIDSVTAKGPGIIDMKGGDVVLLFALKALAATGQLDRLNLSVIFNGDEEDAGEPRALARQALVERARGAAAAIGFEDGSGDPGKAVVARRSYTGWKLVVTGKPAHSSQIFRSDIGPGAVFETARILNGFRERLAGERYLTFNPGIALGGTSVTLDSTDTRGTAAGKGNVVAERMVVTGDLRTISPEQLAKAKASMRAVIAGSLPWTQAELTFTDGYPPLPPNPGNRRLLALVDRADRDLGFGGVTGTDPMRAGAADVSFTAGIVPMAIDGIGLAGRDDHTAGETADLAALPRLIARAALLLTRLSPPPTP